MKAALHKLTLILTPVLIGMAGFFLVTGAFVAAFWAMMVVVLCMETRVRAGYTFKREPTFWAHVAVGALLLVALGALSLFAMPALMQWATVFVFIIVSLSGGRLLVRQLQ